MGSFSWMCADCGDQILSEGYSWECFKCEDGFYGKEETKLLIPETIEIDGIQYLLYTDTDGFVESDYEGYGVFGGMDAHTLLARLNAPHECPSLLTPTGRLKSGKALMKAILDISNEEAMGEERSLGIRLDYGNGKLAYPIKIVHTRCIPYEPCYHDMHYSQHDPNQGWQTNRNTEGSLEICEGCY